MKAFEMRLAADFFEFSPERFTRPGVIAGIVLMVVGLIVVLAADGISRALNAWYAKRRDIASLKRDDGKMKQEGGSEKDDAERRARKSIGTTNLSIARRLVGTLILVAGAVTALVCAD